MIGPAARARWRRDHRWTPTRLSAYLDGDLPPRSRRRLERHVDDCPECRAALRGLRRLLDRLHDVATVEPDTPDIAAAVLGRIGDGGS